MYVIDLPKNNSPWHIQNQHKIRVSGIWSLSLLFKTCSRTQLLVTFILNQTFFYISTFKTKLKCVTLFLKGLFCFCNENCLHKAKSLVLDTRGHILLMRGSFCFFWNGGVFFLYYKQEKWKFKLSCVFKRM